MLCARDLEARRQDSSCLPPWLLWNPLSPRTGVQARPRGERPSQDELSTKASAVDEPIRDSCPSRAACGLQLIGNQPGGSQPDLLAHIVIEIKDGGF